MSDMRPPAKGNNDDLRDADILRLEMAKEPHKPELIDYFTRLGIEQVNTIAFFRSLRDKSKMSIEQIKSIQPKLSPLEIGFIEARRSKLAADGKNPDEPFSGCMSLCNNYCKLIVSLDGKHLQEWFGMLEPKANVTHNSIGPMLEGTNGHKKGFLGIGKKE